MSEENHIVPEENINILENAGIDESAPEVPPSEALDEDLEQEHTEEQKEIDTTEQNTNTPEDSATNQIPVDVLDEILNKDADREPKDDILDNILQKAESENIPDQTNDDDSDSSSSSDSESSSDSSSDDSDSEGENKSGDEDEFVDALEEEDVGTSGPIVSLHEAEDVAEELNEDFKIGENEAIEHIGEIISVVEKSVIIKGNLSGEFRFLKEGSILCLEDKTPIGYLHEVFGPVASPLYRVTFKTAESASKFKDFKKARVFYVVPKSSFVYTDSIKTSKGSDASNIHDEEIPEEEQEFSDDEKEMQFKKSKKNKKQRSSKQDDSNKPKKQKTFNNNPRWQNNRQAPQQQFNQAPPNLGYQSRSQREQQQQQHLPQHNPLYASALPNLQPGVNPSPFQPPANMMPMNNPVPVLPMPPVFPPPPNMQPAQAQQFFQMQQIMMQQFFAQQQFLNQQQQQQGKPPGPTNN